MRSKWPLSSSTVRTRSRKRWPLAAKLKTNGFRAVGANLSSNTSSANDFLPVPAASYLILVTQTDAFFANVLPRFSIFRRKYRTLPRRGLPCSSLSGLPALSKNTTPSGSGTLHPGSLRSTISRIGLFHQRKKDCPRSVNAAPANPLVSAVIQIVSVGIGPPSQFTAGLRGATGPELYRCLSRHLVSKNHAPV